MQSETLILPDKSQGIWHGDREKIVFIEMSGRYPVCVMTAQYWDHRGMEWYSPEPGQSGTGLCPRCYDFDWSMTHQSLLYDQSSFGGDFAIPLRRWKGPVLIWDPIVEFYIEDKRGNRKRAARESDWTKLRYRRLKNPPLVLGSRNPFEHAVDCPAIWCDKCRDHIPDNSDRPCRHMHWCDDCGMHVYDSDRQLVDEAGQFCDCEEGEGDE